MTSLLASIFLLSLLGLAVAVPYPFSYYWSQYQDEGEGQEQRYISPPNYGSPQDYESQVPEAMMEEEDMFEQESETQQDLPADNDMANMQLHYQNDWDQPLHFECKSGDGIDHVQSVQDNRREDRRWRFGCAKLPTKTSGNEHCQWNKINHYDAPMFFTCPANYYVAGVSSRHDNGREDREWNVKCCRIPTLCTSQCSLTQFINAFDGSMHYTSPHGIFYTGFSSYHDNGKEDRRWKVYECNISNCSAWSQEKE